MVFWWKRKPQVELSPAADDLLRLAVQEHNLKNDALIREWSFGNVAEWNCDQDTGEFVMVTHDCDTVVADFQAVGSFEKRSRTWEWAWNNPNIDKKLCVDSQLVKAFGKREAISYLTLPMFKTPKTGDVTEYVTYLGAIASKVTAAQGVFPGDIGDLVLVVTLKNLRRVA